MLLTRLPLDDDLFPTSCKHSIFNINQRATSFDLHVLGMPPAFILSQDQTLQKNKYLQEILVFFLVFSLCYSKLTFCSVFKEQFVHFQPFFGLAVNNIPNNSLLVNTFFTFSHFIILYKKRDLRIKIATIYMIAI